MKIYSGSLLVLTLVSTGCGVFQKDDDSPRGGQGITSTDFSLTGTVVSDVPEVEVTAFANRTSLLKSFEFTSLQLSSAVSTQAGSVSRRRDGIAQCIRTTIKNHPLQVTADSVGFDLKLDFVAICDAEAEPDDLIDEVRNSLTATMTIGCAGGLTLEAYKGKTVGDLEQGSSLCNSAAAVTYAYSYKLDARKTTKTKIGSQSEITGVSSVLMAASLNAPAGGPCVMNTDPVPGSNVSSMTSAMLAKAPAGDRHLVACRWAFQTKSFSGKPKDELNSPTDTTKPHPTVYQSVVDVTNATMKSDVPYYTAATTTFRFNQWQGVVTYANGWALPKWEATLPGTSAKVEGEIGAPQQTTGGIGNNNNPAPGTTDTVPLEPVVVVTEG